MCSTVALAPDRQEVDEQPLESLERQICELAAHIAVATCRWLELVAEFDDRLGWAEWGVKTCAHWLSWRCSLSLEAARERVRVAHRLQLLPLVQGAFARGELSYCKVRALTRVATPATEAGLLEIARHATGAQLEKLVRGYAGALSATLGAAQQTLDRRYLRWSWNDDGSLRLEGRLPAADGALVLEALAAVEAAPSEGDDYVESPAGARRADALVGMAGGAVRGRRLRGIARRSPPGRCSGGYGAVRPGGGAGGGRGVGALRVGRARRRPDARVRRGGGALAPCRWAGAGARDGEAAGVRCGRGADR
jgi:hypothetical protein